ncbi:MAG: CshA/CshB family fibrillar adhesin-related protein, partial [Accumulibacter sp.]
MKIIILQFSNRFAGLLLLLVFGLVMSGANRVAYAGYADGTGGGQYQNQIYWLDWRGFTFANGQSRTFNLPGGVTVTATVSNLSGGTITIARPEDYGPAAMNRAYPNTGYTAIKSCTACTNRFRLTLSASVSGTAIPVDMVVADAEAADSQEYLKVTTDGNAWQLLEQFQAANLRATWSNNDQTLELHGNGATTYGTALAVSTNVIQFDFELKGSGISAAALGVFLPLDYGDAPASFGDAGHYIRQTFTGGLPGATKVYNPVSTAFTNFAVISDAPTVFVGAVKPDADPGSLNTGANAATALGDDTNNTDDEDGVASFPPLTRNATSYAVNVTVHNTSGGPAMLWGWVDFNGDGQFSADESASATVANGSNPASVTLNWPTVHVTAPQGTKIYARLRITTGNLTANDATGAAADGEAEDYVLPSGTLVVVKNAVGSDGSFTFNSQRLTPPSFALTTTSGTAQRTFANLLPGTYDVGETVPAGWELTSATCSDSSDPASINIGSGETVTCTFANTKRASLTIIKNTLYGDGTFDFASQALGAFSLTTVNGTAQQTFDLLAPGTYDVSETIPNGWRLDSATCDDGSNPASVNLAAGEDVTCTFNDTKLNSIIAIKATVGGDDTFPFVSQTLGNFSLTTVNGLAQSSFNDLPAGTYDLSEMVPASWTLSSATCSDGSDPANIQLSPGETVACVFIDLKQNTIVVEKHAVGGDDRFSFTGSPSIGAFALNTTNGVASQSFGGLLAGTYAINETVPTGWRQTGATCDNGNSPSNIQLAPGQTVKCTFENEKQDTIIVVKRAVGGDGTFPFVSQTLGNFNLKTVKGQAQKSFTNLSPGIYDLSETVPAGWTLSGTPTCSDGSPVNHIDLR